MADLVMTVATTLVPDDVLVRAVQFFTNERWRAQSQTNRIATFVGIGKVPMTKTLIGLFLAFFFVLPGVVYYLLVIGKMRRMQNIVVTTTPLPDGCSVVVTYPKHAQGLVDSFASVLPGGALASAASATS